MTRFVTDTVQVHVAAYFEEFNTYKFLVLKRSSKLKVYPGIWQVITGTIEQNETPIETAIRETNEEIGCKPDRIWTLPYITQFFNHYTNVIHFSPVFGVLIESTSEIKISEEHDKFTWLYLDTALEKLALPTHRDASKIFQEYILSKEDKSIFEIIYT
jgi:dATP pyrophosphohydrolase